MNELELLKEQNNLASTLNTLNIEILNTIESRKNIATYILEYRKKFIEEYKDDEDKLIEYFDHERYIKEESYKSMDKRLSQYTKLKESPYFGKINFNDGYFEEQVYIGRYGLLSKESENPVVIDWRAPVASLFYKGILGKTSYKTPEGDIDAEILARRQLIIKKAVLEGFFDSDIDVKDDILQMILSSNSGKKLKDIIMSIQEEQDEIIREERMKVLVVNGVAGSGKTTIALHRVAYLLYNYREQLENKLLILGPNDVFIDYICEILPNLGESDVTQETFKSFAINEIDLDEDVTDFTVYLEYALKGDEKILEEIKYKTSDKFIEFLDTKCAFLDDNYFNYENVILFGEEVVSVDEIDELFEKHYKYMNLFKRSQKVKRILISKIKDKRDELVRSVNSSAKEKLESLSEEERLMESNNIEFQRKIKIREVIREVMICKERLNSWINNKSILEIYKEMLGIEKLSYLDLPAILYIAIKLEGKKCKKEIKHIVIDEAQDYSMLQFIVLKELTGCRSYSIVGDSNQRLVKFEDEPSMLKLKKLFGGFVKRYDLTKSYRSTNQIMKYSSELLKENSLVPFVRNGKFDVEEVTINNEDDLIDGILEILENYDEEKYENIAIITKDKEDLKFILPKLNEFTKILSFDKSNVMYKGGKVIIPSYYAKGLEFDAVIVLNLEEKLDNLLKYIMCTRALHQLNVINYKK